MVSNNQIDKMHFVCHYEQLWRTYLHCDRSAGRLLPKSLGDIAAHIDFYIIGSNKKSANLLLVHRNQ